MTKHEFVCKYILDILYLENKNNYPHVLKNIEADTEKLSDIIKTGIQIWDNITCETAEALNND